MHESILARYADRLDFMPPKKSQGGGEPARHRWREPALAAAGGFLLFAAFPPLDFGPLSFVALVPLARVWRTVSPRRATWLGFVAGVAAFGPLVWWTSLFGVVAWVALTVALAATWAVAGFFVAGVRVLGLRSPWVMPVVWSLVELGRQRWPFGGNTWGEVGYTLHSIPSSRSFAAIAGTTGVGFVVVSVNAWLAEIWAGRSGTDRDRSYRPAPRIAVLRIVVAVVIVPVVVFGGARLFQPSFTRTGELDVVMLQGNDNDRGEDPSEVEKQRLLRNHLALAEGIRGPVDLVVFPESSVDKDPRRDDELRATFAGLARRLRASLVVNVDHAEVPGREDEDVALNTNFLFNSDGKLSSRWYAKVKVVPFGEYVPWRSVLQPLVPALDQVPIDLLRGPGRVQFDVAGHRVGTFICFEVGFATFARNYAREGAEVLLVTTNNSSFRRSPNTRQQLAMAQMRAAESGRYLLQSGISGITAVIDERGRVVQRTELFELSVTQATVPTLKGRTPYVRFGDWLPLAAGLMLLLALARRVTPRVKVWYAPGGSNPEPSD